MSEVRAGTQIQLDKLVLWDCNPRMLKPLEGQSQIDIARAMNDEFDPIEIGRSVAAAGWNDSSVLSVTSEGMPKEKFLVIEGNRRLTALLALVDSDLRSRLSNSEAWDVQSEKARAGKRIPALVPCIVYPTRSDAENRLGPMHFVGMKGWEPFQKDRFILQRIDAGGPIAEIAASLSIEELDGRKAVLIFRVFQSLGSGAYGRLPEKHYGNLRELVLKFGAIRKHMRLPDAQRTDEAFSGLTSESDSPSKEILTWVFGTSPDKGSDPDEGRKVQESRDYRKLNRVVQSIAGIDALRDPLTTLEEALAIVIAEGHDPCLLFEEHAKVLSDALVNLRRLYHDQGEDVISEKARQYLAGAVKLVGSIDALLALPY